MSMEVVSPTRNARVAHIRKFCCVPPERGALLRLLTCEDPPMTLGEWLRDQCADNASVPEDVDMRLREHASTTGVETNANLVWQSGEGGVVASKRLRCRPDSDPMAGTDAASMEALGIVGTEQGKALQYQRHHEAMMRLWMEQFRLLSQQQTQQNQMLLHHTMESHRAAHQAHLELDKLRAQQRRELDQVAIAMREQIANDNGGADPEKAARADFIRQVSGALLQAAPALIEMIADRYLAGDEEPAAAAPAPPKAS